MNVTCRIRKQNDQSLPTARSFSAVAGEAPADRPVDLFRVRGLSDLARALGALPAAVQVVIWLFVIVCVGLGWLGSKPPEGIYVILARVFTIYYFAFFLMILPLLGIFEKTNPVPNSISESVLGAKV